MLSRFFLLRNWNILSKIVGFNLLILCAAFLGITGYIIPAYEDHLLEEHKVFTASMVDIATAVITRQYERSQQGIVSEAEAQKRSIETIKVMAHGSDYFWIHNLDLIMIAHPIVPELENSTLADYRDSTGQKIFVEMNAKLKQSDRATLSYLWPKPSSRHPVSKVSSIRLFKPWGWVVGSGKYYDDIKKTTAELRWQVIMICGVILGIVIIFSVYAASRINQPLKQALRITRSIARPQTEDILEAETSDEPKLLLHAIERMVSELKGAKDEADRANRVKSDFLARMSHEIRTPMNAVVGMTELALESAASLDQKEYLEGVRQSADHLMELINEILDYSKIEAGHLKLESIRFSFRGTLAATMNPLAFRAKQKGLECTLDISPDIPDDLSGDPLRLRQMVTNLVGNAIKFTKKGGVAVSITPVEIAEGSVRVRLLVTDTGIGIPEEVRLTIFDPFAQASTGTTRTYGGTGLGLAIVKDLAEMMGGSITLKSTLGVGSVFVLELPFEMSSGDASETQVSGYDDGELREPGAPARSLCVLVADDNELNQVVATKFLEALGHRVTVVDNGKEAVERWEEGEFDVVMMDVLMPEMDGLDATRFIREQERKNGGRIPIIAMTANAAEEDARLCREAGMDVHLPKPLRRAALAAALEKI